MVALIDLHMTYTAVKKSVWLVRRVAVIADGVKQGEIQPIHINDPDMCADPLTKYLTFPVWDRHMAYMLNRLPASCGVQ